MKPGLQEEKPVTENLSSKNMYSTPNSTMFERWGKYYHHPSSHSPFGDDCVLSNNFYNL